MSHDVGSKARLSRQKVALEALKGQKTVAQLAIR